MILSVDPGKGKYGIALFDDSGDIIDKKILQKESLLSSLANYISRHRISTIIVGQGHFGKELLKEISKMQTGAEVIFVSEKYSTLEARKRYWKDNRPKGVWRLVPTSLRVPPVPVDDYAAVILGERYLKQ